MYASDFNVLIVGILYVWIRTKIWYKLKLVFEWKLNKIGIKIVLISFIVGHKLEIKLIFMINYINYSGYQMHSIITLYNYH